MELFQVSQELQQKVRRNSDRLRDSELRESVCVEPVSIESNLSQLGSDFAKRPANHEVAIS
jgi:hypothetical protein